MRMKEGGSLNSTVKHPSPSKKPTNLDVIAFKLKLKGSLPKFQKDISKDNFPELNKSKTV